MNRYPDMGCTALYDALADDAAASPSTGWPPGPARSALLYQILQAFCDPGDEVVYAWRSFEAYPIVGRASAARRAVQVPVTATRRHDLDAMADAVTDRTRLVLVCTPNNPTGPAVTQPSSATFLDRVPRDVLVVVDEAYREFVRDGRRRDALAVHRAHPNVVVTAHLLEGLRAGRPPGRVRRRAPAGGGRPAQDGSLPFGVSRHRAGRRRSPRWRPSPSCSSGSTRWSPSAPGCSRRCASQGWSCPDTQANFVWLPLGERAVEFAAAARRRGAVACARSPATACACTIGEPEANDRLLEVCARTALGVDFPSH